MIKSTLVFIGIVLSGASLGQVEIYNEDFQSGLPVTYTIVNNDGLTPHSSVSEFGSAWIELVDPDDAGDTIVGSTSYFDPSGHADRWLITPPITLGAYGNIAYWDAKSHDPSFPDDYMVLVSTTDTQITSFTDTLLEVTNELEYWNEREANFDSLSNNVAGMTIHLAFVNNTEDGFKLYLDSIRVVKEDPSGLNEISIVQFNIYPNPSSDIINVSVNQDIIRLRVYDLNGRLMIEETSKSVGIRSLLPGSYIIEISTDEGIGRQRFLKL